MSSYTIVGSYDDHTSKRIDESTVVIPLIDSSGRFLYGINNVLESMKKSDMYPSDTGIDILILGLLVFLADTKISRNSSEDTWTREISLKVPVKDILSWNNSKLLLERMLRFLSGDIWTIDFIKRNITFSESQEYGQRSEDFDTVTLFSGGMDSLISTINLLEEGHKAVLCAHSNDPAIKNSQTTITKNLKNKYGDEALKYLSLWTDFQIDAMPDSEISTRSRSFLFISFAACAITANKGIHTLLVPENGLIALNVPLENLRLGSYSTRTTHPFYLECWNELLNELRLDIHVINPYWNNTKGEMASECKNKDILYQQMRFSYSCSSPKKLRYQGFGTIHCGYCLPCLIRRAAMHKAFDDDPTNYAIDDIARMCSDRVGEQGVQIRSIQYAAEKIKNHPGIEKLLIYKPGPLGNDEQYLSELADTYKRGILEVDDFIQSELQEQKQ